MKISKLSLLSMFGFLIFWQLLAAVNWIDADLFPAPLSIFQDLSSNLATESMWWNFWATIRRLILGFLLGWPFGVGLAIATGMSEKFRSALSPFINFGYPLPKVALLPLILVVFGIGELSKIALIAIGVFFLVYISVFNGMLLLKDKPIMDVAKVYKIRGWNFWGKILLRGLALDIMTGSKSAFGYGLVLVVVAEAQMTREGLGYFIWQAWDQYRIIEIYDGLLILGVIGLLAGSLFDRMTQWLVRRHSEN
jgi:ABC-type nitrate/sulfonate/bicarbonate transport system permease component